MDFRPLTCAYTSYMQSCSGTSTSAALAWASSVNQLSSWACASCPTSSCASASQPDHSCAGEETLHTTPHCRLAHRQPWWSHSAGKHTAELESVSAMPQGCGQQDQYTIKEKRQFSKKLLSTKYLQHVAGVVARAHRRIRNLPAQDGGVVPVVQPRQRILVQDDGAHVRLERFLRDCATHESEQYQ